MVLIHPHIIVHLFSSITNLSSSFTHHETSWRFQVPGPHPYSKSDLRSEKRHGCSFSQGPNRKHCSSSLKLLAWVRFCLEMLGDIQKIPKEYEKLTTSINWIYTYIYIHTMCKSLDRYRSIVSWKEQRNSTFPWPYNSRLGCWPLTGNGTWRRAWSKTFTHVQGFNLPKHRT